MKRLHTVALAAKKAAKKKAAKKAASRKRAKKKASKKVGYVPDRRPPGSKKY